MLTRKQLDLLEFIHIRLQKDGVPPSFDEMKEALDLRSKSGIHRLITALEERGFIRRLAHRARAIEILRLPESIDGGGFQPRIIEGSLTPPPAAALPIEAANALTLPIMGRIAAGTPIEAIQQVSNNVSVPGEMLKNSGRHYALEVKGDSMIEAGINDGDIVVINEQNENFIKQYESKVPLKRMARSEEIAPAVTFLLSEESSYITGHNLVVDGGWTAI